MIFVQLWRALDSKENWSRVLYRITKCQTEHAMEDEVCQHGGHGYGPLWFGFEGVVPVWTLVSTIPIIYVLYICLIQCFQST